MMDVDEKLIKEITHYVIEEIKKISNDPGENRLGNDAAAKGIDVKEVVIGVGPAYGTKIRKTIAGLDHWEVLKQIMAGIEEEGMVPRVIKVYKTSDVAFIGKEAAFLSGSGIGIGLQSKGTVIIHQKDLQPLSNIELFPQAPLITIQKYRQIGINAARYAKGMSVAPIAVENDCMVRPKFQVKAALMHIKETEEVDKARQTIEIKKVEG
jgi:glycerol dehydratase medium subunit/propanediol dehydratase medium subunit